MGQPRVIREAANQLHRAKSALPGAYGVVTAPYISPAAAEICLKEGIDRGSRRSEKLRGIRRTLDSDERAIRQRDAFEKVNFLLRRLGSLSLKT